LRHFGGFGLHAIQKKVVTKIRDENEGIKGKGSTEERNDETGKVTVRPKVVPAPIEDFGAENGAEIANKSRVLPSINIPHLSPHLHHFV